MSQSTRKSCLSAKATAGLLLCLFCENFAWADVCTEDLDCKDKICVQGTCVQGSAGIDLKKSRSSQNVHSNYFQGGYGVISLIAGAHSFGKWKLTNEDNGDVIERGSLSGGITMGARLSAYKILRQGQFQIGGTITYARGLANEWERTLTDGFKETNTIRQFSFGLSIKGGFQLSSCIWLGAILDFGPIIHVTQSWQADMYAKTDNTSDADIGLQITPHISLNYVFLDNGNFKLGLSVEAGVSLVPGIADIESSLTSRRENQRFLTPVVSVGLMIGS